MPDVLRSGDHGRVDRWRRAQALARTRARRPDLIVARGGLTEQEQALLAEFDLDALALSQFVLRPAGALSLMNPAS